MKGKALGKTPMVRVLRFSRRQMVALEAVLLIAHYARSRPLRASWLARQCGCSGRYLEQPLQKLVHCRVIKSQRGPHGGYVLARERRKISVGDVLRALAAGEDSDRTARTKLGQAILNPIWTDLSCQGMGNVDNLSLEELCRRAEAAGIMDGTSSAQDFTI